MAKNRLDLSTLSELKKFAQEGNQVADLMSNNFPEHFSASWNEQQT